MDGRGEGTGTTGEQDASGCTKLPHSVAFTLDGRAVTADAGESILEAARRHGTDIPHLCHKDGLLPEGNCRACVVDIKGERVLAPSCCRAPAPGMEVSTGAARAVAARKMVIELLMADVVEGAGAPQSELAFWAQKVGVGVPRFAPRARIAADSSHPAISVDLAACINCTRCLRACRDIQGNDVIGYAYRGHRSRIVFDLDDPMSASTCVACGECVSACPTGALSPALRKADDRPDKTVDSLCGYCGVGCQLTFHVKGNRIVHVEGRDGPANHGRLCVKGRFGSDYVHHRHRLTRPLIRKAGIGKGPDSVVDPADPMAAFREATWDEALDAAANGLRAIRDRDGPSALAGFGSAKGSNEEAYLFQKLVRTGFGTNNVDHCTRLCHASSVTALLESIGSGSVSNPVVDVLLADVVIVIGSNPTSNHPVAATWIKNAARNGTRLILADPRRSDLARHATHYLQFNPDTDVALLNAMLHTIVDEALVDEAFIRDRTTGYDALREHVRAFTPEAMAPICGIPAETIRTVARLYATSKRSMILWGMGVSQHVHGTDNVRCLIALAMTTGQIGRPGTGLHPLRGQNNVQGASDSGLIPMVYPDYQRVDNPRAREKFESLWGTRLDPEPGLTVVEIMNAVGKGRIKGLYIMGENPAMSDPDVNHARQALSDLEHLVVQDIFLTETARFADVVLPAAAFPERTGTFTNTDRTVQLGRQAIEPPGEARSDLWIIQRLAERFGLNWRYGGPADVFAEMRKAMPSIAGVTWDRLEQDSSVTYPCRNEGDPGEPVVFVESFPTPTGRAALVPVDIIAAAERPDGHYPMVLITGRQLEHWHTGSMTRRSAVLDAIEPEPVASLNPLDIALLGCAPGDVVTVESRRGRIALYARADQGTPRGAVFIAFCYYEAAANALTNGALDPFAKIPEFKYCAVRVRPGGTLQPRSGFGGGQALAASAP